MDTQRLKELIDAAGYTAEAYRHNGDLVVSLTVNPVAHNVFTALSNVVRQCATVSEAGDLVRRCYMRETNTTLVLFWPHAMWVL
jgi:hypothetical protein